jgi:hypothetical protein
VSDLTQLNSDVIRVFKQSFDVDENPNLDDVVKGETDFYTHTTTSAGVKLGLWSKVGQSKETGSLDLLFRGAKDGTRKPDEPMKKVSTDWYIWRVNDNEFTYVGKLEGDYRKAEMGLIYSPYNIMNRLKGIYNIFPDFE